MNTLDIVLLATTLIGFIMGRTDQTAHAWSRHSNRPAPGCALLPCRRNMDKRHDRLGELAMLSSRVHCSACFGCDSLFRCRHDNKVAAKPCLPWYSGPFAGRIPFGIHRNACHNNGCKGNFRHNARQQHNRGNIAERICVIQ